MSAYSPSKRISPTSPHTYVLRSRSAAPSGCCLPPRSGLTRVSDISGRLWGLPALARRPGSIGLRLTDARGGVLRSRSAAPSGCCLPPRSGLTRVSDVSGRLWGLPALARRPGSIGLRLTDARGGVLRSRSAAPSGCCLPPRSGLTRVSDVSGRLWGLSALARRPGSIGLRLTDARGGVLRSRSAAPSRCCLPILTVRSDDPGVFGATTAGGIDHQTARRGDPGQRQIRQGTVVRIGAAKVDERPKIHMPRLQGAAAQRGM